MAKSTWYAHQSTVYDSIIQIAESKEVEYLQMLRATGTAAGVLCRCCMVPPWL